MSSIDNTHNTILPYSSILGIARGIFVHACIYPLEVIKVIQQSRFNQETSYQVGLRLYQEAGIRVFYRGLPQQLLKTSLKQAWSWPMITGLPAFLERYSSRSLVNQALTGLAIATIDAGFTTPLERSKFLSIFTQSGRLPWKDLYKEGWKGFFTHWGKLSINWSAFLVAQQYFRDKCRGNDKRRPLNLSELSTIGVKVAFIVSVVSAPFDVANTLKQAQNRGISYLFSGNIIRKMYRGWPLSAVSLVIHNIASVYLIEQLRVINKTNRR